MAISKEKWLEVQGFYEAGLSLAKITEKTGVDRSTISKKAKNQQWEKSKNADYIKAKELIVERKSTLTVENQQLLNCADIVADDNIRRKNLVFGGMELLAQNANKYVENNKVQNTVSTKMGVDVVETEFQSKNYLEMANTYEKLGKSMGVVEDKASVQIANQNVQEKVNDIKIVVEG